MPNGNGIGLTDIGKYARVIANIPTPSWYEGAPHVQYIESYVEQYKTRIRIQSNEACFRPCETCRRIV